jgi:hypothetical protein
MTLIKKGFSKKERSKYISRIVEEVMNFVIPRDIYIKFKEHFPSAFDKNNPTRILELYIFKRGIEGAKSIDLPDDLVLELCRIKEDSEGNFIRVEQLNYTAEELVTRANKSDLVTASKINHTTSPIDLNKLLDYEKKLNKESNLNATFIQGIIGTIETTEGFIASSTPRQKAEFPSIYDPSNITARLEVDILLQSLITDKRTHRRELELAKYLCAYPNMPDTLTETPEQLYNQAEANLRITSIHLSL